MDIAYFTPRANDTVPTGFVPFCQDQQKLNLFWLIDPCLDTLGLVSLRFNPAVVDIHRHLDLQTRAALKKTPVEFMRYWRRIDDGDLMLTEHFPIGYIGIMQARANAWRRPANKFGNVVQVDFPQKSRRIGQQA